MPRDLESEKATLDAMAPLTKEMTNDSAASAPSTLFPHETDDRDKIMKDMDQLDSRSKLHPYVKSLTISDLDSCLALEATAFPPDQRASREKLRYRLTKCGELSIGLFTSARPNSEYRGAETYESATPLDSSDPDRKAVLLAFVLATQTHNVTVKDADMDFPTNWESDFHAASEVGHQDFGRTVAVHSVAVLPAYRHIGLGGMILRAYMLRMQHSGVADRISLLTYDRLTSFYESLGFENKGKSTAQHGGIDWNDMIFEFPKSRASARPLRCERLMKRTSNDVKDSAAASAKDGGSH